MARTSAIPRVGGMASASQHAEVRCPRCGGSVTKTEMGRVDSAPDWVTAYERRDAPDYRRKTTRASFYGCNACDWCATVADQQAGRAA